MSSEGRTPCVLSSTSDVTEPHDVYEIALAPPARRAITSKLPPDVAAAAVDFITGPLIGNPETAGEAAARAAGWHLERTPHAGLARAVRDR